MAAGGIREFGYLHGIGGTRAGAVRPVRDRVMSAWLEERGDGLLMGTMDEGEWRCGDTELIGIPVVLVLTQSPASLYRGPSVVWF